MALFSRGDKPKEPEQPQASQARPVPGRMSLCRVCDKQQPFSRCWIRVTALTQCPCCGVMFPNPAAVYQQTLPACPQCGEYLEQPGFEYGLCDGCGSKYELVKGTKPGLLPNRQQRAEMATHGQVWRRK